MSHTSTNLKIPNVNDSDNDPFDELVIGSALDWLDAILGPAAVKLAPAANTYSTTSTSFVAVDAANLRATFNIPVAQAGALDVELIAFAPIFFMSTGGQALYGSFLKDGVEVSGQGHGLVYTTANIKHPAAWYWRDKKPAAGAHNYDVAFAVTGGTGFLSEGVASPLLAARVVPAAA